MVSRVLSDAEDKPSFDYYRYDNEDDCSDIAYDIEKLYANVAKRPLEEQSPAVFEIARSVITQVLPLLEKGWDDHDGNVCTLMDTAYFRIKRLASAAKTDKKLKAVIFVWATTELAKKRSGSWSGEWILQYLEIAQATADSPDEYSIVLSLCDTCMQRQTSDYSKYLQEDIALFKVSVLKKTKRKDERKSFIAEHLHMDKILELAITEAYNAKKFQESRDLAEKGILQNPEDQYSSSTDRYREHLIHAMDALEQKSEASALVEKWAIKETSGDWFKTLKRRSPKKEWEAIRERIFTSIEKAKNTHSILAHLYESEKLYDRLMTVCEADDWCFSAHYERLIPKYPSRVAPLLSAKICAKAQKDSSRTSYRDTALIIQKYARCAGIEKAKALIDELTSLYSNRPAMKQEYAKVRLK